VRPPMKVSEKETDGLSRLGFRFSYGSVLTKRTLMFHELKQLLECVPEPEADNKVYFRKIIDENCLGKKTYSNRRYTYKYLTALYGLDPGECLFRSLRYFHQRDPDSLPDLAILAAFSRDNIIRSSSAYILSLPIGTKPDKQSFENYIEQHFPGRFGEIMLHSLIRNLLSAWTQSGHLSGKANKVRKKVTPTSASVAFSILLGYLSGIRGRELLESELMKLLECSYPDAIEKAEGASQRGWIIFKRVGDVIEVSFPSQINRQESEWIHE
jgi:hypothetical protein